MASSTAGGRGGEGGVVSDLAGKRRERRNTKDPTATEWLLQPLAFISCVAAWEQHAPPGGRLLSVPVSLLQRNKRPFQLFESENDAQL